MRVAYIDYSMSVIVSRALPDVRDGLKPVHRRVLYGMHGLGLHASRSHKKSARIVGEVLGKYHPHGDVSVYDAMVRMAQPWSLRYPLVDGQGNFGSVDGDSPAAMRYTEVRFLRFAEEMLADIDKETVNFRANFDDTLQEPAVLPSRVPSLLVNGSSGIAVGMATSIAPHNLCEVVDALVAYIADDQITVEVLMQHIKSPDFPTGGVIYGYKGVVDAYQTGRGRIVMRARVKVEEEERRIVVTEIPFLVNKAAMIEKTAALVNEKKIAGIADIRDESDRGGLRIVYEVTRDANPHVVLNHLYKYTQLQSTFGVNNVALVKGKPVLLNLKDMVVHYVNHRHEVLIRRLTYEREEKERRLHILEGYLLITGVLEAVIRLIRASRTPEDAKAGLMKEYELSEKQATAVLDLRLQKLTGLEREKIRKEHDQVVVDIRRLKEILERRDLQMGAIKEEFLEVKERYGDERRTDIEMEAEDLSMEDFIPDDEVVVTVSRAGYIKRTSIEAYRAQGRGGVGARGVDLKEDDFTEHIFITSNHSYLLIFTNSAQLYWLKVYEVPMGKKNARGRPIQNLVQIRPGDSICTFFPVCNLSDEAYASSHYLVMCTVQGRIKKTALSAYARPKRNGVRALVIRESDRLLNVCLTGGEQQIVIASAQGKAIRFPEEQVRPMGRVSAGVKGITLGGADDAVVGMVCVPSGEEQLLVVSEKGYGKRSLIGDYRITHRGGKGVKTLQITDRTGRLMTIRCVAENDHLFIVSKAGIVIRMLVNQTPVIGRGTQGVRLIRLGSKDAIASLGMQSGLLGEETPEAE